MKKTVFFTIALLTSIGLTAQTTHHLDWFMNIPVADASLTIDEGDTVIWHLTDTAPHTVTNDPGSAETFDSGTIGVAQTYSFTFTVVGTNPYHCNFHGNMNGVITVNALGVDEKSIRNFSISPNPASSELFIELPNRVENLKVKVFNITGKLVHSQEIGAVRSSINVSNWSDGIYMLELTNGEASQTKRFIKK